MAAGVDSATGERLELTGAQRERIAEWVASWDEGDDRFIHWEIRDRDSETLAAIQDILGKNFHREAVAQPFGELRRLLDLVRNLAPNPSLDRRLDHGDSEFATLWSDLRELLYGPTAIGERVERFMARRGAGPQTVSQLLCAAFPERIVLVSGVETEAIRTLEMSGIQLRSAEAAARQYGASQEASSQVNGLLRDWAILEAIMGVAGVANYVELHRVLQTALRSEPPRLGRPRVALVAREERVRYRSLRSFAPNAETAEACSELALLAALERHADARGFTYPSLALRSYYVSLKTKPFAILSGISGTGKTRLTHLFAEFLTGASGQYLLVPVRPDWTDPTPLLGYHNILARPDGTYVSTRFLDLVEEAGKPENSGRAYFVCLDEMNLARPEHYFAEFLSGMEAPDREIPLVDGRSVRIPPNLFVTGTINVDETTHTLSRKVLDRANVIELGDVDLVGSALSVIAESDSPDSRWQAVFLNSRVTGVANARRRLQDIDSRIEARVLASLSDINRRLEPHQLGFAYRLRDEALIFLANSFDAEGQGLFDADVEANAVIAMDLQLTQKVLPRLSGIYDQAVDAVSALLDFTTAGKSYPRTARKLARMLAVARRSGFVSFHDG